MRRLVTILALVSGLAVSSCRSGDDEIRITSVRLEDNGSKLRAHVGVHNGTAFSLYVYQTPRRILWDEPTKTLTLSARESQCDVNIGGTLCTHYMFPQYVEVDGDDDKDIVFELPRTLSTLGGAKPGGGIEIKKQEISTADRVVIQLAWADEPVDSTAPGQDARAAVIAAEREILNGEWRR